MTEESAPSATSNTGEGTALPAVNAAPPVAEQSAEVKKAWEEVTKNPTDFTKWTFLISQVEQAKPTSIAEIRRVYSAFLKEFPLCFGYWKKYADQEMKNGDGVRKAREVYDSGANAVRHSVDMWQNYITFMQETSQDADEIRSVFERALDAVGNDLRDGHQIWDKYIEFETARKEFVRVSSLYGRVVKIPLANVEKFFERCKHFVFSRPASEVLTPEETPAVMDAIAKEEAARREANPDAPADEKAPEQVDGERKSHLMNFREEHYKASAAASAKRKTFEGAIRRPYFHVKALESAQVSNWRKYLRFEEAEGNHEMIVKLYERCLVACALYSEFWQMYARYMAKTNVEEAREIYKRASEVFLKAKPAIHLHFALFEEIQKNADGARAIYENVIKMTPNLLSAVTDFANFERRQGNVEAACKVYEAGMEAQSDSKSAEAAYLTMQYADFCAHTGQPEMVKKARDIYSAGIRKHESNESLWLSFIAFEIEQGGSGMEDRVQALFNLATSETSAFSPASRVTLLQRNVEFAADRSMNPSRLADLRAKYALAVDAAGGAPSRKRAHDGDTTGQPAAKKAAPASGNGTAGAAATDNSAAAAAQYAQYAQQNPAMAQYAQYGQGGYANYQQYYQQAGAYPQYGQWGY